jgi:hypothetical protein
MIFFTQILYYPIASSNDTLVAIIKVPVASFKPRTKAKYLFGFTWNLQSQLLVGKIMPKEKLAAFNDWRRSIYRQSGAAQMNTLLDLPQTLDSSIPYLLLELDMLPLEEVNSIYSFNDLWLIPLLLAAFSI